MKYYQTQHFLAVTVLVVCSSFLGVLMLSSNPEDSISAPADNRIVQETDNPQILSNNDRQWAEESADIDVVTDAISPDMNDTIGEELVDGVSPIEVISYDLGNSANLAAAVTVDTGPGIDSDSIRSAAFGSGSNSAGGSSDSALLGSGISSGGGTGGGGGSGGSSPNPSTSGGSSEDSGHTSGGGRSVFPEDNPSDTVPTDDDTQDQSHVMIWFFHLEIDPLESLITALSSGIPTHVAIFTSNRWTSTLLEQQRYVVKLNQAVSLIKEHQAKSILIRDIWPTRQVPHLNESILFDSSYYRREIELVRLEGQTYQTDFVGFDLEAYGRIEDSPVRKYLEWDANYIPSSTQLLNLRHIVSMVVSQAGKVDYIYPGGSLRDYHYYNILSSMGRIRIAESTYYDTDVYQQVRYPYEIFGAYLNTVVNEAGFDYPFYLVPAIFDKEYRWSSKQGLFLYPREGKALEVAERLLAHSLQE